MTTLLRESIRLPGLGKPFNRDRASTLQRHPAASDLPAERKAGRRCIPVCGLARRRGAVLVAAVTTQSTRSLPLAVQGALGGRRLAWAAGGTPASPRPGG